MKLHECFENIRRQGGDITVAKVIRVECIKAGVQPPEDVIARIRNGIATIYDVSSLTLRMLMPEGSPQ